LAKEWGCPPYKIEEDLESGLFSFGDIIDALNWSRINSFSGDNVDNFIFLEEIIEQNKKRKIIEQYNELLKTTNDPETKKRILEKIKDIGKT
jgi:hypothetical protein